MRVYGDPDRQSKKNRNTQRWRLHTTPEDLQRERLQVKCRETAVGDLNLSMQIVMRLEEHEILTVADMLSQPQKVVDALSVYGFRALRACCDALRQIEIESIYCRIVAPQRKKKTR